MARPLRIERPGTCYHITVRGNKRAAKEKELRAMLATGHKKIQNPET